MSMQHFLIKKAVYTLSRRVYGGKEDDAYQRMTIF